MFWEVFEGGQTLPQASGEVNKQWPDALRERLTLNLSHHELHSSVHWSIYLYLFAMKNLYLCVTATLWFFHKNTFKCAYNVLALMNILSVQWFGVNMKLSTHWTFSLPFTSGVSLSDSFSWTAFFCSLAFFLTSFFFADFWDFVCMMSVQ